MVAQAQEKEKFEPKHLFLFTKVIKLPVYINRVFGIDWLPGWSGLNSDERLNENLTLSFTVVNVHICQLRGHEINAYRCLSNAMGDQPPWLILVN